MQPLRQRQGDLALALCPGAEDDRLGFGEFRHGGFPLLVVRGKKGGDAQHEVVVAVSILADDHVAIVVAVQIGDLATAGRWRRRRR